MLLRTSPDATSYLPSLADAEVDSEVLVLGGIRSPTPRPDQPGLEQATAAGVVPVARSIPSLHDDEFPEIFLSSKVGLAPPA